MSFSRDGHCVLVSSLDDNARLLDKNNGEMLNRCVCVRACVRVRVRVRMRVCVCVCVCGGGGGVHACVCCVCVCVCACVCVHVCATIRLKILHSDIFKSFLFFP